MITIRNDKRTILRFAAAALAVLLFCGAASATEVTPIGGSPRELTADQWNELGSISYLINGNIKITGDGTIYPKFNSTVFTPSSDVTIDFSGYSGTFAGEPDASGSDRGALFGQVQISGEFTLTIMNLKMENVNVTTSNGGNSCYGGIVGEVRGNGASTSSLEFVNCTLKNCKVDAGTMVGGLVGYAYSTSVKATNCNLQHCDIKASGNIVGGLVGYASSASINAKDCIVANCNVTSTGGYDVGGLVGSADSCISVDITSCEVKYTSVNAVGKYVGGLVGYVTKADVNATDCKVLHCDIKAEKEGVGGLIGYAAGDADVDATNCIVANCCVASTGNSNVGGLVGDTGSTNGFSIRLCEVKNTLVYASANGYANAGGLVGYAHRTTKIEQSKVTNCVIAAGDRYVGGLIGNAYSPTGSTLSENTVEKCTVAGSSYVGGLAGYAGTSYVGSGSTDNTVVSCAVKGGENTNLVCGSSEFLEHLECNADITKNYISSPDTIEFKDVSGNPIELSSSTYLTIVKVEATASERANKPTFKPVTYLGQHGTVGGYGFVENVGSMYTVTYETDIQHGSISCYPTEAPEGDTITVTATPKTGYHLNWTYYKKANTANKVQIDGKSFPMPDYNVIVGGDFKPNVITVIFHGGEGATGTMANQTLTYDKEERLKANNFTKTGYNFVGWSKTSSGSTGVDYADKASVKDLLREYNGTVDLHAVWESTSPVSPHTSSSSRDYGASIWLPATAEPTAAPTEAQPTQAVPTASPVKPTSQASTPLPLAGIIAGLGAALVFGLRRK